VADSLAGGGGILRLGREDLLPAPVLGHRQKMNYVFATWPRFRLYKEKNSRTNFAGEGHRIAKEKIIKKVDEAHSSSMYQYCNVV
jgi:hypothetical protein